MPLILDTVRARLSPARATGDSVAALSNILNVGALSFSLSAVAGIFVASCVLVL
jgi:hypothetical protein